MFDYLKRPVRLALLAAVALAVVGASSIAAPKGGKGGAGLGRMGQSLNLTQDQKDRIQDIRQTHRQRIQDLMSSNLSAEEKQAQRKELRQDMLRQMNEVLTPEQREQMKQKMSEKRGDRKQMRHQRGQRMLEQLDLSADQRESIAAIRQRTQSAVQSVRQDSSLNDRAKQDRIRVIRQRSHEEMLSVLTPEQREKLQQKCMGPKR